MNEDIVEPPQEEPEVVLEPVETEEVSVEAPKPKKAKKPVDDVPEWTRAEAGDSYLSLAIRFFPDRAPGVCAPELVKLNLNRPIREGVKIRLKETK